MLINGSIVFQPVVRITTPAITTPIELAASAAEWRSTPSRLMSVRSPRASTQVATTLPISPTTPSTTTPTPSTVGRVRQPRDRLDDDQHRDHDQRDAVDQRGEHLAALQAEGARGGRRARRQPRGDQRDRDRSDVREQMPGLGDQRQRVGEDAAGDRRGQHRQVDAERGQHARAVGGTPRVEAVAVVVRHLRSKLVKRWAGAPLFQLRPRLGDCGGGRVARGFLACAVSRAVGRSAARTKPAPCRRSPSRSPNARRTRPPACAPRPAAGSGPCPRRSGRSWRRGTTSRAGSRSTTRTRRPGPSASSSPTSSRRRP